MTEKGGSMDVDVARQILSAAKEGGYYDGDLPETDEQAQEEGQFYFDEAVKMYDTGMKNNPTIQTILRLGGKETVEDEVRETYPRSSSGGYPGTDLDAEKEPEEPTAKSRADKKAAKGHAELDAQAEVAIANDKPEAVGAEAISDVKQGPSFVEDIVRRQNLPVPPDIQGDAMEVPRDLSQLPDKELRRLNGEYTAFLARTLWLLTIENADLANAETMYNHEYNSALRRVERKDPDTGKAKIQRILEAEVELDPDVVSWSNTVEKHKQAAQTWRSLADIYKSILDRVSREWTMRQDEFEKSR